MDRQHREGGKTGSGYGLLTAADQHSHRRQRLLKLAMDTIDLSKDPYVIRNHLGQLECVLCMTIHTNEGSYLAHCQAKKHQANLGRRAAREAAQQSGQQALGRLAPQAAAVAMKQSRAARVGRPHFSLKKIADESGRKGIVLHLQFPGIATAHQPAFRLMSAFEQRLEAPNRAFQYLLVAGEPYETIAFKVPNRPVVQDLCFDYWDPDFKVYSVQIVLDNK